MLNIIEIFVLLVLTTLGHFFMDLFFVLIRTQEKILSGSRTKGPDPDLKHWICVYIFLNCIPAPWAEWWPAAGGDFLVGQQQPAAVSALWP